jgi:tRNA A-37 threonylcarbamoyl transferase component Bud32
LIKNIEELVQNVKKYSDVVIHQSFKSKKNTVAYVTMNNKPRVLKWFVPGFKNQMKIEYSVLEKGASKLKIPFPYEVDEENNVIIMSYITGENLCDLINDEKTNNKEKERLIILLADWFVKFHIHFKKDNQFHIRGDAGLRNFILSDRIWGVDFEESRVGMPVEDIARLCSSILTTDPMFTSEKFKLCKRFIESYKNSINWNLGDIYDELSYALLEKIQWRPEDEKTLRNYSKIIKEKGL